MAKPVFSPTQFELRNELPVVVSEEQRSQIELATGRVNQQLDWVAQALGWSGTNYWTALPQSVGEKRALLGGTFGVYNSYTLARLREVREWEQRLIVESVPNLAIGQRVIIGNQQAYVYGFEEKDGEVSLDVGTLSDEILSLLEQGAAVKIDIPQNRPFPFYRPEPLASGDADFRCSTGLLRESTSFYDFYDLILSPYSQGAEVLPYPDLQLYSGSYYYFDRAVYLSIDPITFIPWVECQWIESKGLWQLYVHPEFAGQRCYIVWPYASQSRRSLATAPADVIKWTDPSDWGKGGSSFNPILDVYKIERSYDISALNYGLGTSASISNLAPQGESSLWFDSLSNVLYAWRKGQWIAVGDLDGVSALSGQDAPPPNPNQPSPGLVWQSPEGRVYVWAAAPLPDPESPLYYLDPSYIVQGGFSFYDLTENSGFWETEPAPTAGWSEIHFYDEAVKTTVFTLSYADSLYVTVNDFEIGTELDTENYSVSWRVVGDFLYISYLAKTSEGEFNVPRIGVKSRYSFNDEELFVGEDFTGRPIEKTSVPYSESGVLNNFRGAWGNKGGARSLDFVFDALDIHGFNEQEALYLEPINNLIDYDWMLHQVTGKQVFVGDFPPPAPKIGDYYWNNDTGALAVYYGEPRLSPTWVEINYPNSPCQIGGDCDYFPLKPILTTGSCVLDNGDTWQDPITPGAAIYYEGLNFNPFWVELNWNQELQINSGWPFSESPSPEVNFNSLIIYVTDPDTGDFLELEPGVSYETNDFVLTYSIEEPECGYRFHYEALTPVGVQQFPDVWVGPQTQDFLPVNITEQVFSDAKFFAAPAVQNAGCTLRPWKTVSLEVTSTTHLEEDTYHNQFVADKNLGPGDENWDRSFIRLPSEYGRNGKKWGQAELAVQDFTYAGTAGNLKSMRCPTQPVVPRLYDEVIFLRQEPNLGTILYSEPYLYSSVEGFENPINYYRKSRENSGAFVDADFDFGVEVSYDEWQEADLESYEPLHYRQVRSNGDWDGVYLKYTGNVELSGFVERDLRVKSIITVAAPVWDSSIYKYPPLCAEPAAGFVENPNNSKVVYAYFSADLAAAEDGFFDQQKDVAWRKPIVNNQTLYLLNN